MTLAWSDLAVLRQLEEPGTAAEVAERVYAAEGVRLSADDAAQLLDAQVRHYRALRQGSGAQATYMRMEPGTRAVQDAGRQQATARAEGVLL